MLPMKTRTHDLDFIADAAIAPGEVREIRREVQCVFRADYAVAAQGVDYEAFEVEQVFVGEWEQFEPGTHRRASELLVNLRRPSDYREGRGRKLRDGALDACEGRLSITLRIKNVSDRLQHFAIKLLGEAAV